MAITDKLKNSRWDIILLNYYHDKGQNRVGLLSILYMFVMIFLNTRI